jgi:phosphoribosylaminoimidazole-succinocarboxamide synthase
MRAVYQSQESGLRLLRRGKVRDVYALDDGQHLLIVATDRVSAFDCVLPTPIPGKGLILTAMSNYWFERTVRIVPNHVVDADPYADNWEFEHLRGRAVVARRADVVPVEAIVRGYLAGSAWKEYRASGAVCGIKLPAGLRESERLPQPLFTPSTKAPQGSHDENIPFEEVARLIGPELAARVRDVSLQLYVFAAQHALDRGFIIADTKFELGIVDGQLTLIDEAITPDSSRFWEAAAYQAGKPQYSYDKQYLRDYLESLSWSKTPPAPEIPCGVVRETRSRYLAICRALTNSSPVLPDSRPCDCHAERGAAAEAQRQ